MAGRLGTPSGAVDSGGPPRLLVWSGPDREAERSARDSLTRLLARCDSAAFGQVAEAWSLAANGAVRAAVVATSAREAIETLDCEPAREAAGEPLPLALLLPGEGSERERMVASLYGSHPVLTAAIDEVLERLGPLGAEIRADWHAIEPALPVHHPLRSLPMVFAVDYALGRVLLDWGVQPAVIVGQGIGEWVGAVLASVMPLAAAVDMVGELAACFVRSPRSAALAVACGQAEAAAHLHSAAMLACENGAGQIIVSGPLEAIEASELALRLAGISCMRLRGRVAYRSAAAAPARAVGRAILTRTTLGVPSMPLLSATTASRVSPEQARDASFWAGQPTEPVRLRDTLDLLFADRAYCCVQAGSGQALSALVSRHPAVSQGSSTVFPMLRDRPAAVDDDRRSLLSTAAHLWISGHPVELAAVRAGHPGRGAAPPAEF